MSKIFISYRRSDSQMVAGRLRDSLTKRFGDDAIFRDKDSIAGGEDWTLAIKESLAGEGVVMLALIGPTWASVLDENGRARLHDPGDWNRIEIEQALQLRKRIIPVLIDYARMPKEADLPATIKTFTRMNALRLRDDDWESDVERIVRALGIRSVSERLRLPAVLVAIAALAIAVGAGYWHYSLRDADQDSINLQPRTSSFRDDILSALAGSQYQALDLLSTDKPKAIGQIDKNLAEIDEALASFPKDAEFHALAGYGAKNVYASSKGLLAADKRREYLARARKSFEIALQIDPDNAAAHNGMGNVLFYEGEFDAAIEQHKQALKLANGNYPAAEHDRELVERVRKGELPLD